ncbi:MAG TPA: pesticidal protein Cry5Ba, partial [Sulfitobacter sp.]|nr:pesticidal protein Cry5Ba [Sulfitobacter sp.]
MSLDIIATYAVAVLLIIGSFFVVVAGIGLLKLN